MYRTTGFAVGLASLAMVAMASAADLESGPKVGQSIGAFNVVKCAGAPDDGIALGRTLCYR